MEERGIKMGVGGGKERIVNSIQTKTPIALAALKGATSLAAGSPAVLDQTVIVLDQTVIVLDRTVIVLDRTVITICGVLSFPSVWRWVRPN